MVDVVALLLELGAVDWAPDAVRREGTRKLLCHRALVQHEWCCIDTGLLARLTAVFVLTALRWSLMCNRTRTA